MLLYNRIVIWHWAACRVGTRTEGTKVWARAPLVIADGPLTRQPGRCQRLDVIVEFIYNPMMHFHLAVGKDDSVCVSDT